MALNPIYVYRGAFTVTFTGGASKAYSGVRKDHISFNLETKEDVEEMVDGNELTTIGGRRLVIEIVIDELVTADLDNIETYDTTVAFLFGEMAAGQDTITITGPKVIVHIENMKPKIRVILAGSSDATIASLMAIA